MLIKVKSFLFVIGRMLRGADQPCACRSPSHTPAVPVQWHWTLLTQLHTLLRTGQDNITAAFHQHLWSAWVLVYIISSSVPILTRCLGMDTLWETLCSAALLPTDAPHHKIAKQQHENVWVGTNKVYFFSLFFFFFAHTCNYCCSFGCRSYHTILGGQHFSCASAWNWSFAEGGPETRLLQGLFSKLQRAKWSPNTFN